MTYVPWSDSSGGWPKQTAKVDGTGKEYWRVGTSNTAWSAWVDAYGTAVNSAKTATNYLGFSTNGLVVGTNSGGTGQTNLLGNVRLYSGGMEVRNGSTVLARYGASEIDLGVNSSNSVINLCSGSGQLGYNSSKGAYMASTHGVYLSCGAPGSSDWTKNGIGVYSDGIQIFSQGDYLWGGDLMFIGKIKRLTTLSTGLTYFRTGGMCVLMANNLSLTKNSLKSLGTLPSDCRPVIQTVAPLIVSGGDTSVWSGTVGRLMVQTSGAVTAFTSGESNGNYCGSLVFATTGI